MLSMFDEDYVEPIYATEIGERIEYEFSLKKFRKTKAWKDAMNKLIRQYNKLSKEQCYDLVK